MIRIWGIKYQVNHWQAIIVDVDYYRLWSKNAIYYFWIYSCHTLDVISHNSSIFSIKTISIPRRINIEVNQLGTFICLRKMEFCIFHGIGKYKYLQKNITTIIIYIFLYNMFCIYTYMYLPIFKFSHNGGECEYLNKTSIAYPNKGQSNICAININK